MEIVLKIRTDIPSLCEETHRVYWHLPPDVLPKLWLLARWDLNPCFRSVVATDTPACSTTQSSLSLIPCSVQGIHLGFVITLTISVWCRVQIWPLDVAQWRLHTLSLLSPLEWVSYLARALLAFMVVKCLEIPLWKGAVHLSYGGMGLWKCLVECSQSNVRLSKYFGSPELITFPCLCLWGVSLQKFTTSHMAFKQMLSVDSVCFYFNPFLEVLMLSWDLPCWVRAGVLLAGHSSVCFMNITSDTCGWAGVLIFSLTPPFCSAPPLWPKLDLVVFGWSDFNMRKLTSEVVKFLQIPQHRVVWLLLSILRIVTLILDNSQMS